MNLEKDGMTLYIYFKNLKNININLSIYFLYLLLFFFSLKKNIYNLNNLILKK